MSKSFQFLHNSLALFALIGIVAVSVITTLSLSPVVIKSQNSTQVAGVSTFHNATPVEAVLLNSNQIGIQATMQQNADGEYTYNLNLSPLNKQFIDLSAFRLVNSNPSDAQVTIQAIVPRNIGNYLNLGIVDGNQTLGLYNSLDNQARIVTLNVPGGSNLSYVLKMETTTDLFFGGSLLLQIKSK